MKLTKEFTKLEKSAVKLTVTIAKKDVEDGYNATISKYVKNAQIPGFRKGHVPVSVLERKYGDALKADVCADLIDKALNELFSDENEKESRSLVLCFGSTTHVGAGDSRRTRGAYRSRAHAPSWRKRPTC